MLDGIASLADNSLLHRAAGPDGEPRFAMLATVREYGLEQLAESGEAAAVRDRHAAHVLQLAEQSQAPIRDHADPWWLARLDAIHDDVRAALTWLETSQDDDAHVRLAGAMLWFWYYRSHRTEAALRLERALGRDTAGSARARALALAGLGILRHEQGAFAQGVRRLQEGLALFCSLNDRWGVAYASLYLGYAALGRGDYAAAAARCAEAYRLFEEIGDGQWVGTATYMLGLAAHGQGDANRAAVLLADALARVRHVGDELVSGICQTVLGVVMCDLGDHATAADHLAQSLPVLRRFGVGEWLTDWLSAVATLAAERGQGDLAARLFGAADRLDARLGTPFSLPERPHYQRTQRTLRRTMGDSAFTAAWAAGRELTAELAIGEAMPVLAVDRAPPAGTAMGLTPREVEVLRLVAAGLPDREIADALSISPRTVGGHVTSILSKFGVSSRAAAAAEAVRIGVV